MIEHRRSDRQAPRRRRDEENQEGQAERRQGNPDEGSASWTATRKSVPLHHQAPASPRAPVGDRARRRRLPLPTRVEERADGGRPRPDDVSVAACRPGTATATARTHLPRGIGSSGGEARRHRAWARWKRRVLRCPENGAGRDGPEERTPSRRARRRPERYSWAALMKRTFEIDVLHCPCGARRRVLSVVCDPTQICRVLEHMGLPADPPERAPPRKV